MYTFLCKEDIERMKAYYIETIESENIQTIQDIILSIICYTNTAIDFENYLIEQVSKGLDTLSLKYLLRILAWIGDERVVNFL